MICGGRKRFTNIGDTKTTPLVIEQFIEPCILLLLCSAPLHGYAIMQELQKTCLCESIDIGNFYRVLTRLKKEKMIVSKKEGRKAVYDITKEGKKFLAGWVTTLEKNKEILSLFLKKYKEVVHV